MKAIIRVNMDNDAFSDAPLAELQRAVNEALDKMYNGQEVGNVRDYNGNVIGKVTILE